MSHDRVRRIRSWPTLSFGCLLVLLGVLWLAGGASREDAAGQALVRMAAAVLSIIPLLFGEKGGIGSLFRTVRPVAVFLVAALALALLQLVPLPPAMWQALPGRAMLSEAASASGQLQPWRPWSMVPGATVNAAASLVVPIAIFLLTMGSQRAERRMLPGVMLFFIAAMTMVGLLQFSGAGFSNPLVDSSPSEVSAMFANRNHFALLLAVGCILAPIWAFPVDRTPHWRGPTSIGLVLLFALSILATGSRAGLALGMMGLVLGIIYIRQPIRRMLRDQPRWQILVGASVLAALIMTVLLTSVFAGRAVSVDRIFGLALESDMRQRGLSTVLSMVRIYFPIGSGLGSFDPLFRIHEPFVLLAPTYFNHAHDDWIEIVLDAGLPGALLLMGGVAWWMWAGLGIWRRRDRGLRPLGWSILLLVFMASAFDYPARTPIFMAIVVVAGLWLCEDQGNRASALPRKER